MANEDTIRIWLETEGDWQELARWLHSGTLTGATRRREVMKAWMLTVSSFAEADLHAQAPVGESGYMQAHIGRSGQHYVPGGAGGGGSYVETVGVRAGSSMHPLYVHFGTAQRSIYGQLSSGAQELLARGAAFSAPVQQQTSEAPGISRGRSPFEAVSGIGPSGLLSNPTTGRIYPRGNRAAASVIETRKRRVTGQNFMEHVQGRKPALAIRKRGEVSFRAWVSGQKPNPFLYETFVHTAIYAKGGLRAIARAFFPNAVAAGRLDRPG